MNKLISVGWILASDVPDGLLSSYEQAIDCLLSHLRDQFPELTWEMPLLERRIHPPYGAVDPLPLLEMANAEKLCPS